MTLSEWYEKRRGSSSINMSLPNTINNDLRKLFSAHDGESASNVLRGNRRQLIQEVYAWTGMNRKRLTALLDELTDRIEFLKLKIGPEETVLKMMSVSIFVTTLVMNYLLTGQFVDT
jgi:hypothetical protein